MTAAGARSAPRRAPRLRPDQRIGAHFTRRGRFRRIDPMRPRPLPSLARVVGAIGWAALLGESLRRAIKRSRQDSAPGGGADPAQGGSQGSAQRDGVGAAQRDGADPALRDGATLAQRHRPTER